MDKTEEDVFATWIRRYPQAATAARRFRDWLRDWRRRNPDDTRPFRELLSEYANQSRS